MAITDYWELQTAVEKWLNQEDMAERIPEMIALAEDRIAADIRFRAAMTALSETLAAGDNSIAYPPDALELVTPLYLMDDNVRFPLTERSMEWVLTNYPDTDADAGMPTDYYISAGDTCVFNCKAKKDYTITGTYYKKFRLTEEEPENWLCTNFPALLLHATMLECQNYLNRDSRLELTLYNEQLKRARRYENRTATAGGPRRMTQMSLDGWRYLQYRGHKTACMQRNNVI